MLPRLLDLYRSKGVQFVTLEEAETDEFYRPDTDLRQPPGASTLEGLIAQRHLALPAHAMPSVQLDTFVADWVHTEQRLPSHNRRVVSV
jgi:peptidoglycan-N-acetylglucosamine deacetylase